MAALPADAPALRLICLPRLQAGDSNRAATGVPLRLSLQEFYPSWPAKRHRASHGQMERNGRSRKMTSGSRQFLHVERLPIFLSMPEVILNLLVQPAFRTGVEGHRETDCHLRADARTPVKNARKRLPTHAERPRGVRNGQVQGFQAQLPEHLTGMRRIMHLHGHLNGSPRSLRDLRPSLYR